MTEPPKLKRAGRPAGAKTQPRPEALAYEVPAQCPGCRSTRRGAFGRCLADEQVSIEVNGRRFNRERRHDTQCLDCGQRYRVTTLLQESFPVPPPLPVVPAADEALDAE